jgi:hypothetical protein
MRPSTLTIAALAFGAASLLAGTASAGPDCSMLSLPNPVYIVG